LRGKRRFKIGDVVKVTMLVDANNSFLFPGGLPFRNDGEPVKAITMGGELADRSSLLLKLGVIEDVRIQRGEKLKVTAYVVAFFKSGSGVQDKSFDGYAPFLGDELELVSKVGEKAIVIGGI
jgi:hypothetical protein